MYIVIKKHSLISTIAHVQNIVILHNISMHSLYLHENFSGADFLDNFTYFRKPLVHNKNDIGCIFWCIRSCSCGIWTTLWVLFRNCMCHVWPFSAKQKWVGQKVFYMRLHDVFWFSRARVTIIFGFLCLHHSIF